MNPHYPIVARRSNHRCEYCRAPEAIFNCVFEVEHIFPTSSGGTSEDSNLALACRNCNVRKSNHLSGRDNVSGEDVVLFNPRKDRWTEHFEIDLDRGEVVGLTAIGRVTVERLRMNDPVQIVARLLWIQLRLFP
jgi:HNH endonuclease